MCLGATARTVTSFSVFIGECSLDILALKFSTTLASPGDEVEAELFNSDCMRDSADLFLRAEKSIGLSPQLQRSEEQELDE